MNHQNKKTGFTVVELLVVIVVIGILATIVVVAYNGIQQRARDTARTSDVAAIIKALELYYIKNGEYPAAGGSTAINTSWSTTADASWDALVTALEPHISVLPSDPLSTPGVAVTSSGSNGYNYAYYANRSTWCGAGYLQMYILIYRYENLPEENTDVGDCSTNPIGPYGNSSNRRVIK